MAIKMRMHMLQGVMVILMLMISGIGTRVYAQSDTETEYRIKALYLLNFAKGVEWAAFCFPSSTTPITVAIIGEDPFGQVIDGVLSGRKIGNRSIVVKRFATVDDIDMCHILFVGESEKDNIEPILEAARFWYALTVGDFKPFAQKGGIMNFVFQDDRIRVEYNPEAAQASYIKISDDIRKVTATVKTDR